jgi:protein-disulfide reductase (glutathione)
VNLEDDEEPAEELYKPDGGYIPRIIFVAPSGERMDVTNEMGKKKKEKKNLFCAQIFL